MLWYCTFEYLYVDKHKYLRTPPYLLLLFVCLCHPPLSPALTLCPWCALFQPRQGYQPMNKWLESFVTKGLSVLSLLHKYLWSRHTNRLTHRAQTFTRSQSRLCTCIDLQEVPLLKMKRARVCVCVTLRVCGCVHVKGSKVLVQKG